ncbi:putative IBR domain-containing protein [Colletotrichum karsti]|uniref:RBR-type E3 ubiquitin transferase n=1 Tax=Colletotrichum karsti TaxID=1095194 RepID=A0A9P6I8E0_9PEZI|nr:putative IBR domain-containing protein [Colletotrichum karsti]KAF9875856.1 putative IBR domain-containing protein [Colletotrichum karsti]
MEHFQLLDEDVASLILRHGFLDIEDLQVVTAEEVENAAALALQMAEPEELVAIAVRQSVHQHHPHLHPAIPIRPAAQQPREEVDDPEDPDPGAYINWQERNRLLTDSPAESDHESQQGGEDCIICSAGREPKIQLPCGCWFCAHCLRACIRAGLRQGGWPPNCCEPLGENTVRRVRRPALLRLYRQVREEQETPGDRRVYCSRPECAAFIPPAGAHVDGDAMRCPACGEGTCRGCRAAAHPGRPCREEEEDEMLMDMIDQDGLSSCSRCRRIIELRDGCNHMTCECGHQFCYLCGSAWNGRCPRGCPAYGARERRVPMRQRAVRYQQARNRIVIPADAVQGGPNPDLPPNVVLPPHMIVPPIPPDVDPMNFDPTFGGMLPVIPWDRLPRGARQAAMHLPPELADMVPVVPLDDLPRAGRVRMPNHEELGPRPGDPPAAMPRLAQLRNPEPVMPGPEIAADAPAAAAVPAGQRRYFIMLFYPDGQNTHLGDPNWRRDSEANRRRIRQGVADEGRVWPLYAIEEEENPRCRHQLHAQWEWQADPDPPCLYCRLRDGRQLWRCRICGVTACDAHRFMRFGLTLGQANAFVERLRDRTTVENDFRYPRANAAGIERWDLFLQGRERRRRRRQGRQRGEFGWGLADVF